MMNIKKVTELYNEVYQSIFTTEPVFSYPELANAFDSLCQAICILPETDHEQEWLYIGEYNECSLSDLIVGAFWHYTEWHSGQYSESYRALCALSGIYSPNMVDGVDCDNYGEKGAFDLLAAMAEECKK